MEQGEGKYSGGMISSKYISRDVLAELLSETVDWHCPRCKSGDIKVDPELNEVECNFCEWKGGLEQAMHSSYYFGDFEVFWFIDREYDPKEYPPNPIEDHYDPPKPR